MRRFYPLLITRWLLLGLLLAAGLRAAGQRPAIIDSLKRALTSTADTTRINVLHELAVEISDSNFSQALGYARQGLAASKQLAWQRGQAQAYEDIGWLYWQRADFDQAQRYTLMALSLWRALGQPRRAVRNTQFIAELLATNGQFLKAAEWQKQALVGARATHDTSLLTDAYMSLGLLQARQHRSDSSLNYYYQALTLLQAENGKPRNGALTAVTLNNIADAYVTLHQPRAALPYSFRALQLGRKYCAKDDVGVFETTLAEAYYKLSKSDMAIYHALKAHQLSTESQNIPSLIYIDNLLDTLYSQQGKYRLAHHYAAQSHALESKVQTQEQERKVAEVQGRYDTKEKERNIQLLTQQNKIAQLATLQQRTLRNAASVIAGLLLLAVGILYNRYRLRQRTVRQLKAQKDALNTQNREKELLLREKTLLLQELHHRVKNNLQIVLSLLRNQLDTLLDPTAAAAIRESQSRVQTMALIHQNLYQSESLARIDMRRYLAELLDAISRAFRREAVTVVLDVVPVHLTTHTAVPLGLIINELVTNAYKYAFAGRTANQLHVELSQTRPNTYCLVVADNGIGLPPIDLEMVQSLGLRLTAGLLSQMDAHLTIDRESGTQFRIVFQEVATVAFEDANQPAPDSSSGWVPV